jgi:hypothetical protein
MIFYSLINSMGQQEKPRGLSRDNLHRHRRRINLSPTLVLNLRQVTSVTFPLPQHNDFALAQFHSLVK